MCVQLKNEAYDYCTEITFFDIFEDVEIIEINRKIIKKRSYTTDSKRNKQIKKRGQRYGIISRRDHPRSEMPCRAYSVTRRWSIIRNNLYVIEIDVGWW